MRFVWALEPAMVPVIWKGNGLIGTVVWEPAPEESRELIRSGLERARAKGYATVRWNAAFDGLPRFGEFTRQRNGSMRMRVFATTELVEQRRLEHNMPRTLPFDQRRIVNAVAQDRSAGPARDLVEMQALAVDVRIADAKPSIHFTIVVDPDLILGRATRWEGRRIVYRELTSNLDRLREIRARFESEIDAFKRAGHWVAGVAAVERVTRR